LGVTQTGAPNNGAPGRDHDGGVEAVSLAKSVGSAGAQWRAPAPRIVMPVLVTGIHGFFRQRKTWMVATSATMTTGGYRTPWVETT
jgi:hypothetical protein